MKSIDVDGLPQELAQALAAIAELWRREVLARETSVRAEKVSLHTRPGKTFGRLTREEIYS